MNKRSRKGQKGQSTHLGNPAGARFAVTRAPSRSRGVKDLVIVAISQTIDEAKDYETLLRNNDIPAVVKRHQDEFGEGKSFAIMAPEEMADEARVIIESQDSYDDFYDSELDNDISEEDLEGDVFED
jgi:hypothetical protein